MKKHIITLIVLIALVVIAQASGLKVFNLSLIDLVNVAVFAFFLPLYAICFYTGKIPFFGIPFKIGGKIIGFVLFCFYAFMALVVAPKADKPQAETQQPQHESYQEWKAERNGNKPALPNEPQRYPAFQDELERREKAALKENPFADLEEIREQLESERNGKKPPLSRKAFQEELERREQDALKKNPFADLEEIKEQLEEEQK